MGEEGAEFAHVRGWHPDLRDEIGGCRGASAMRPLARRTASCLSVLTAALAIHLTWRELATTVRATRGATMS